MCLMCAREQVHSSERCEQFNVVSKAKTKQLHLLSHDSLGQRVPSSQQSRVWFFRFIRLHYATKADAVASFTNSILALCHHHFLHCKCIRRSHLMRATTNTEWI